MSLPASNIAPNALTGKPDRPPGSLQDLNLRLRQSRPEEVDILEGSPRSSAVPGESQGTSAAAISAAAKSKAAWHDYLNPSSSTGTKGDK